MTVTLEYPVLRRALRLVWALLIVLASAWPLSAQNVDLDQITADEEFRWGVTSLHNGRINEAIASLTRSLSFASERSLTRYWLGRAYYYGGFEEAALTEWEWVAERGGRTSVLDKWMERVRLSRGLTTERLGREISPGRYVTMIDLSGRQEELEIFRRPTMVRPRRDGHFYVASFGTHTVVLLDPNGVRKQVIDGGLEGLDRPFDVLVLGDGSLLVSEFGADRIARINPNGFKEGSFGSTGVGDGELLGPQYLAGDGAGHVYVSDHGNARVAKFTTDGEFLFSFGETGADALRSPAGIAVSRGRVYVADTTASRIAIFDESGNPVGDVQAPQIERPEGLSLYREGELLVSDRHRVMVVDLETEAVSVLAEVNEQRRLLGATIDANRNLLAADFESNSVLFLAASEELYTGLNVEIDYVNAVDHPQVFAAVTVTDRAGRPLLGLDETNFRITEDRFATGEADLVYAGHRSGELAVSLVVDRSSSLADDRESIASASQGIYDALEPDDLLWVIGAGEQPVVESSPGAGRLVTSEGAAGSPELYGAGRLDLGIRLGVSELLGERGRGAVVVVSDGSELNGAFVDYSLAETAEHLENNHVTFFVVYTERNASNRELDYLARATDGASVYLFRPQGVGALLQDLRREPSGSYVVRYNSVHDSDFGRRYIPLEVEAYLLERSGRDEAGYFGPLEF